MGEVSAVQAARAVAHPLRGRIIAALAGAERSPVELARQLGAPLGVVSYHVRVLADAGMVELARTTPRRGAIEHHYRLSGAAPAATSLTLSAEGAERLADELREVLERARREAPEQPAQSGDVEVTVLVHRVAVP